MSARSRRAGLAIRGSAVVALCAVLSLAAVQVWLPSLDDPGVPPEGDAARATEAGREPAASSAPALAAPTGRGSVFEVAYEVATIRAQQRPGGVVPGEPLRRVWRYTIAEEGEVDGRRRRTLTGLPVRGPGATEWGPAPAITLTVDVATRALVAIEEAVGLQRVTHPNRYAVGGPEAILFAPGRFMDHIADLPRLPALPSDPALAGVRTIARADGLLPDFEQRLTARADGGWEVELRRQTQEGHLLRVWQHWPAEGGWWLASRITLGDALWIEGRLLGPVAGQRLWLPRVLAEARGD